MRVSHAAVAAISRAAYASLFLGVFTCLLAPLHSSAAGETTSPIWRSPRTVPGSTAQVNEELRNRLRRDRRKPSGSTLLRLRGGAFWLSASAGPEEILNF